MPCLLTRFLIGIAAAGIPAVAMAYIAEEVHGDSIGGAMGLYIGGGANRRNGRTPWRQSVVSGPAGLAFRPLQALALSAWLVQESSGGPPLTPGRLYRRSMIGGRSSPVSGTLANDAALPWLYAEGFPAHGSLRHDLQLCELFTCLAAPVFAQPIRGRRDFSCSISSVPTAPPGSGGWRGDSAARKVVLDTHPGCYWAGIAMTAAPPLIIVILGIGRGHCWLFWSALGGFELGEPAWRCGSGPGRPPSICSSSMSAPAPWALSVVSHGVTRGLGGGLRCSRARWVRSPLLIALRLAAVKPLPENASG